MLGEEGLDPAPGIGGGNRFRAGMHQPRHRPEYPWSVRCVVEEAVAGTRVDPHVVGNAVRCECRLQHWNRGGGPPVLAAVAGYNRAGPGRDVVDI